MVINMKDNNLKDLFQFLLNHKKLIQCGITVSQGSYSITDLNEGVCVLVERNVPFKEYLSFLEIMDKWPEKIMIKVIQLELKARILRDIP